MQVRFDLVNCYVVRPDASGKGHEILQLHRQQDDFMGGTWQTIYGTSLPGETAVAAALRELHEESGLVPAEFYRLERVSIFYIVPEDTLWHCVQFCAIVKRGDAVVLNAEHDASRWLGMAEAEKHFMWQENREAVREIIHDILSSGPAKPYVRIPLPALK